VVSGEVANRRSSVRVYLGSAHSSVIFFDRASSGIRLGMGVGLRVTAMALMLASAAHRYTDLQAPERTKTIALSTVRARHCDSGTVWIAAPGGGSAPPRPWGRGVMESGGDFAARPGKKSSGPR
jgi:hypothetical protein